MHSSQVFLWLLLAFLTGVFAGSFFLIPQDAVWLAAGVGAILIAVFFRRGSRILNPKIAFVAFWALLFLFGVGRFNVVSARQRVLEKFARASSELTDIDPQNKIKITLRGYIDGEPEIKGDRQRLVFRSKFAESAQRLIKTDERVLITTRLYPSYRYGQQIKIYGEPMLPKNFSPPSATGGGGSDFDPVRDHPAEGTATAARGRPVSNGIDYKSYLAKDGIYTLMSYPEIETSAVRLLFVERLKIGFLSQVFVFKKVFVDSINRSISEPHAAFINGILLGAKTQIPAEIQDDFRRAGTSHILAISGYNITMIAGMISWLFLLFLRRQTAFWFSVVGVLLFVVLTGAQASVVRAAIMGLLLLAAQREGRLYGAVNAIIFAGAVMVFLNPQILRYDVGFQLSFMATLGLIYLFPVLEEKFEARRWRLPKFLSFGETLAMTLAAQIFVLPLLLYYFKNLSLVSLPANILVLPLVPYAMLLGFAMGLAGMILPFLGQLVGYFVWLLTSIQLGLIGLLAKPSWAAVSMEFSWYLVVLVYVFGFFVLRMILRRA